MSGLKNIEQRKFILEHRKLDETLEQLSQLACKFEAIEIALNPSQSNIGSTTRKTDELKELRQCFFFHFLKLGFCPQMDFQNWGFFPS